MSEYTACFPFALLALAGALHAADAPSVRTFDDALNRGRFTLTTRLRWEEADQANLSRSDALTLRTAFGLTSAPLAGFQAMLEAENIVSLGDADHYNAAGTNPGGAGRTVIADPPATDLNQAWLGYTGAAAALRVGRQRIVFDNARFVGDSGWRQNLQTFDTAAVSVRPARDLALTYDYGWRVSRVFGNQAPQPDFTGRFHLLNASYGGWAYGRLTAYAYLLDFDNSPANSSDTFGASFAGAAPVTKEFKLTYRAEYAGQQDAGKNPVAYRAGYQLLELGGATGSGSFTAGYELLGSDGGRKGFATPLATLHAFNGWADLFLTTPAKGLRDVYLSAALPLAAGWPAKVVYHEFQSDAGHADYGHEWDAQLARKVGPNCTILGKVARYTGRPPFFDTTRWWLQCEFIH